MKKILFFLTISSLIFFGCKKDKDATYQILNNSSKYQSSTQYLDGSIYEVVVFEYRGNDVVKEVNINKVSYGGGKSNKITAHEKTEKIKVSFKLLPKESPYYNLSSNYRKYTVQYYYLKKGENTIAEINDKTMVSGSITSAKEGTDYGITIKEMIQNIELK